MMKKKRLRIYVLFFCFLSLAAMLFVSTMIKKAKTLVRFNYLCSELEMYIDHFGYFPRSEQEMINQGVLRVRGEGDEKEYEFSLDGYDGMAGWYSMPDLEYFKVNFGVKFDGLAIKDGVVVDRITGEQVYLLSCPEPRASELREELMAISKALYDKMKECTVVGDNLE